MALNRKQVDGRFIQIPVGTGVASGDPVVKGSITGVAITDADDADGAATIDTEGVYTLTVYGLDLNGSATTITQGEEIYADGNGTGVELNKDSTNGKLFGYLLTNTTVTATGASVDVLLAR